MVSKKGTITRWFHHLIISILLVVVSVEFALLILSIITWTDLMTMSMAEWHWSCRLFTLAWAIFVAYIVGLVYKDLDKKGEKNG